MSGIPAELERLLLLAEGLGEQERRELLLQLAGDADSCAPEPGEQWDFVDIRKDSECSDLVGVHLRTAGDGPRLALTFGPCVQTLTRAIGKALCLGLAHASPAECRELPDSIIRRLVGEELIRQRSRTAYYLLHRIRAGMESPRLRPNAQIDGKIS